MNLNVCKLFVFFQLLCCACASAFTSHFSFDLSDFSITENEGILSISTSNVLYSFDYSMPGFPNLPFYKDTVIISSDLDFSSLCYQIEEDDIVAQDIEVREDTTIYLITLEDNVNVKQPESQYLYPNPLVRIYQEEKDGRKSAIIVISPFIYDYSDRSLRFIRRLKVSIDEKEDSRTSLATKSFATLSDPIDYLIITQDTLAEAFLELRDWKIKKGIRTKIITTDSIPYNPYTGITPYDIREYIRLQHQQNGCSMVLLGGAVNIIPSLQYSLPVGSKFVYGLTDMYYSCLGGDSRWDGNNNGIIGECGVDNISYIPTVAVSRIPIRSVNQLKSYIRKVIQYETHPHAEGDSIRMLIAGDSAHWKRNNESDAQFNSQWLAENIHSQFDNVSTGILCDTRNDFDQLEPDTAISATNLVELIDSHHPHWLNMYCHGDVDRWILRPEDFSVIHAASLNNSPTPMIVTTVACFTSLYSEYTPSLAEIMVNNSNGGALAYWGSSYEGIGDGQPGSIGPSMMLIDSFWNALSTDNRFGESVSWAKLQYAARGNIGNERYDFLLKSMNPLGDCELPIYTEKPKEFSNIRVWFDYSDIHFEHDDGLTNWRAAYESKYDNGEKYFSVGTGDDYEYFVLNQGSVPCTFCLTKKNYIPFIAETGRYVGTEANNDLYLQNIEYDSNEYIYNVDNDVFIGDSVDEESCQGNVVISSGATVNIDFEHRAVIQSGFRCLKGGRLTFNYDYLD